MIDFVIPCHPKDFSTLELCVNGVKQISNRRKIYVISKENPKLTDVNYISEKKYNKFFTLDKIEEIFEQRQSTYKYRSSWLYQQFLKLLCFKVIKKLSKSFVVLDSDTIFLRDVHFDRNLFYFSTAYEYHLPYIKPIEILLDTNKTIGFSCINHHMIFNKRKIEMLINYIENKFNNNFVDVILSIIDYNELSFFSEWDLYANYMILNHNKICVHKQLLHKDIPFIPTEEDLKILQNDYDFVSCHAWMR